MDEAPVTAGEYRRFVRETGSVTVAERSLDAGVLDDRDDLRRESHPASTLTRHERQELGRHRPMQT